MTNNQQRRTTLEGLHEDLALELRDAIKNGMRTVDKKGRIVRHPASPAYLNVVRQFLKDNNINALPTNNNSLQSVLLALQNDNALTLEEGLESEDNYLLSNTPYKQHVEAVQNNLTERLLKSYEDEQKR